jgi:hypothetical protein
MKRILLATLVCLASLFPAAADAAVEFEEYCQLEGLQAPLRQTVIVIDERKITPETGEAISAKNEGWRRYVADLLDMNRTGVTRDFLPRERVAIFVARSDGSGLIPVFTGCMPFFSDAEAKAMAEERGSFGKALDDFFGWGAMARQKKDLDVMNRALAGAFLEAARPDRLSKQSGGTQSFAESGLVASMKRSRAADLSRGLPRIFLVTDLSAYAFPAAKDVTQAREHGLKLGREAQVNLDRTELYIVSDGGLSETTRHLLHSFWLEGQARLVALSGMGTMAELQGNPVSLEIFQGTVSYPMGDYPMRMRLALDRNGTAVNSWVSVQSDVDRFTPFGGVMTCEGEGDCSFIGDKLFAQIWTKDPDAEPEFAPWMPFAGVREFEFQLKADRLKGLAFDSSADIAGTDDNRLEFELTRLSTGVY